MKTVHSDCSSQISFNVFLFCPETIIDYFLFVYIVFLRRSNIFVSTGIFEFQTLRFQSFGIMFKRFKYFKYAYVRVIEMIIYKCFNVQVIFPYK